MPLRRLSGPEIGKLTEILFEAFPTPNEFADLLFFRLNQRYTTFQAMGDAHQHVIRNALVQANARYWHGDLLREARNVLPQDPALMVFAEQFDLAPTVTTPVGGQMASVTGSQLELKIKAAQSTYDILTWRKRLGEIEGQVCRIEFPEKTARGTGFLIGPNAVLTNYHVIEKVHKGQVSPNDVRLRFDYKVLDDGVAVAKGLLYTLAPDWPYYLSPYSAEDTKMTPAQDPPPEELDFAILRVNGSPGDDPVGGVTDDPKALPRRWVPLPAEDYDFSMQSAIYIVQHPDGLPMQIALDANGVVGVNGNGTRVRYTTTTKPGSSGSPCFGPDWQWVAVHHAGDPKYWQGQLPEWNRGIPVAAIRKSVVSQGKQVVFGGMI